MGQGSGGSEGQGEPVRLMATLTPGACNGATTGALPRAMKAFLLRGALLKEGRSDPLLLPQVKKPTGPPLGLLHLSGMQLGVGGGAGGQSGQGTRAIKPQTLRQVG